jgi:vesicle coat complex subunit
LPILILDLSYRKDAIQRTIAAMTLGKDVSALFPDVLKNIATPDIEQKKLVYLYLMWVVLDITIEKMLKLTSR